MQTSLKIKVSRSHLQDYIDCERAAYYRYYFAGTGVVRGGQNLDLAIGTSVHAGLAEFLSDTLAFNGRASEDIAVAVGLQTIRDLVIKHDLEGDFKPHLALIEGLIRAWIQIRWPRLSHLEVISVEKEYEIEIAPGIILMLRPDAVLGNRSSGVGFPLEFKTATNVNDKFLEGFGYDLQMSALVLAARQEGLESDTVLLEVMNKGTRRKDKTGTPQWYSPLVRGKGATVAERLENLSPEEHGGLVYYREVGRSESQLEMWLAQAVLNGQRIQQQLLEGRDAFRGRFDRSCFQNKYYKSCPYLGICYGEIEEKNMLDVGGFVVRESHHVGEFVEVE